MSYITPVDAPVTDDWQAHKDRGSAEPGTDYACAYGTPIRAVQGGVVSVVDDSPEGPEGRRLSIDLIDGTRVSYIHLDRIDAYVGQHVAQGQTGLALSGASGFGENYYYGPHLHLTLWESPGMPYWDTIDFELYIGTPPNNPSPEEPLMAYSIVPLAEGGIWLTSLVNGNRVQVTSPYHVELLQRVKANNSNDEMLQAELDIANTYISRLDVAQPHSSTATVKITSAGVLAVGLVLLVLRALK